MQTYRDAQIVEWVGRVGAAAAAHVSERFDMHRAVAYRRLRSLRSDGLLEHHQLLYRVPGMYVATRSGLRWQRLDRFRVCRLSLTTFEHAWRVTSVAAALHHALPGWQILSERELSVQEDDERRLIGSAWVARAGAPAGRHRADLALVSPSGALAAIEVELSHKARAKLEPICRGWARARHVRHVYYLAETSAGRGVTRATRTVRATDAITVLDQDDVAGLAERELARERASAARVDAMHEPAAGRTRELFA